MQSLPVGHFRLLVNFFVQVGERSSARLVATVDSRPISLACVLWGGGLGGAVAALILLFQAVAAPDSSGTVTVGYRKCC